MQSNNVEPKEITDQALEVFWRSLRDGRPGPWASDHTLQSRKFTGVVYVVVDAIAQWVASSTVRLMRKTGGATEGTITYDVEVGTMPFSAGRGAKSSNDPPIIKSVTQAGAQENDELWEPLPADHPAWVPFRRPNPQQTISDVLYEHTMQECLTGTGMTWQVPNGYGEPSEIYVIPQAMTSSLPPNPNYPNGAYMVFPLYTSGPFANVPGYAAISGVIIPSQYMAISRKWHPFIKYDGYSPLQACGLQLDILQQIDESRWNDFQNGIDPSIYIELPPGTSNENWRELQNKIEANHSGTRNRKKPLALTGGARPIPISMTPASMGYETGWDQMSKFVCAIYRTPVVVAGLAPSASYAEWYSALKQFYTGTLIPVCKKTADHWTLHIIEPAYPGEQIRAQIDPPAIDDQEQLLGRLSFLRNAGAVTKGEVRLALGYPKFGDERDDELAGEGDTMNVNLSSEGKGRPKDSKDTRRSNVDRDRDDPDSGDSKGSLPSRVAKSLLNAAEFLNGNGVHQ